MGQHLFLLRVGARDFNIMVFHGPIFLTLRWRAGLHGPAFILTPWWRALLQYLGVPWACTYSYSVVAHDFNSMMFHGPAFILTPWWRALLQYRGVPSASVYSYSVLARATSIAWCSMDQYLFLIRRWRARLHGPPLILTPWWRALLQYRGAPWASIYSYSVLARATSISRCSIGLLLFLLRGGARDFNIMVFHGPAFNSYSVLARATSISWCSMDQYLFLTRRWRARLHGPAFILTPWWCARLQ